MNSEDIVLKMKNFEQRLHDGEDRFSRHLEIYANNGKELAKLTEMILENNKQTQEMYEIFSGLSTTNKWTKMFFKWIVAFVVGVGSLFVAFNIISRFIAEHIK